MSQWDRFIAAYEAGVRDGATMGHSRGYLRGYLDGAEDGYRDGQVQGRHDVRSGFARTQAARDTLDALRRFDESHLRRQSPEARHRAGLVAPGHDLAVSAAEHAQQRLAVVLEALDIAAHREAVRRVAS
jgi:hypothetical protein